MFRIGEEEKEEEEEEEEVVFLTRLGAEKMWPALKEKTMGAG